jgi:hypothetical protein
MPQDQHYIPAFYLRRCVDKEDGKLCVYSRPYDCVKAYRKPPEATGYEKDLYAIHGAGDETANHLEGRFLLRADTQAAEALDLLESGPGAVLDDRQRSAWSRFIMRLLHGNPEAVDNWSSKATEVAAEAQDRFRANYASLRRTTDPEAYEDYPHKAPEHYVAQTTVLALQTMMDNKHVGAYLNRMAWVVAPLQTSYWLLTSDRPLVMTNGISGPGKYLAMPMGPRLLLIAADDLTEAQQLARQDHNELIELMNDRVVRQARRFVWGLDDSRLQFVEHGWETCFRALHWRLDRSSPPLRLALDYALLARGGRAKTRAPA